MIKHISEPASFSDIQYVLSAAPRAQFGPKPGSVFLSGVKSHEKRSTAPATPRDLSALPGHRFHNRGNVQCFAGNH